MIVSGVQCNALPHWKEMVFNTTERDVNTTVNYRCAPSEVFADKSVMKTSACSSAGEWTPVIQSCQGQSHLYEGLRAKVGYSYPTFNIFVEIREKC